MDETIKGLHLEWTHNKLKKEVAITQEHKKFSFSAYACHSKTDIRVRGAEHEEKLQAACYQANAIWMLVTFHSDLGQTFSKWFGIEKDDTAPMGYKPIQLSQKPEFCL